jgi:hypothetical protein
MQELLGAGQPMSATDIDVLPGPGSATPSGGTARAAG